MTTRDRCHTALSLWNEWWSGGPLHRSSARDGGLLLTALAYLAGIAVAAPPAGPLTLLVYRYAMVRDFAAAMAVAAVIVVVDGVYAALSTWGHTLLDQAPASLLLAMRLAGVTLVAALGLRYLLRPPRFDPSRPRRSAAPAAAQGIGIALLNPTPLVSWVVVVDVLRTALDPALELSPGQRVAVPLAVSAGVGTWYAGMLLVLRRLVRPPSPAFARRAVRVVGVVLLITAAVYAWQALPPLWSAHAEGGATTPWGG